MEMTFRHFKWFFAHLYYFEPINIWIDNNILIKNFISAFDIDWLDDFFVENINHYEKTIFLKNNKNHENVFDFNECLGIWKTIPNQDIYTPATLICSNNEFLKKIEKEKET